MSYRLGHCPQCGAQIVIQDTNRRWNSFKKNYRLADLIFDDGHRCRTAICNSCLENPNFEKLIQSITCETSQACNEKVKTFLKSKNIPIGIQEKV